MENYEFTPESIYNLDETGITTATEVDKGLAQKQSLQKKLKNLRDWRKNQTTQTQ